MQVLYRRCRLDLYCFLMNLFQDRLSRHRHLRRYQLPKYQQTDQIRLDNLVPM